MIWMVQLVLSSASPNLRDPRSPSSSEEFARLRGKLLRSWRQSAGTLQASVAKSAGMSDSALSAWERGDRAVDLVQASGFREAIKKIGVHLRAPHALPGLWAAAGTPQGLPPRTDWDFNFSPAGHPCWLWIRCPSDATADLSWGRAVSGQAEVPAAPGGLILQAASSINNPPLNVRLSSAGWVDAGAGTIPPTVVSAIGAKLVYTQDVQRPSNRTPPSGPHQFGILGRVIRDCSRVAIEFGIRWEWAAPHLISMVRGPTSHTIGNQPVADPISLGARNPRKMMLSGEELRLLREARGFSRLSAAIQVNDMDRDLPKISRGSVQRMEVSGRPPRAQHAIARLDTAYGADGQLGVDLVLDSSSAAPLSVSKGRATWSITFPTWWVGPIWISLSSSETATPATVNLTWGIYSRKQLVPPGTTLTCRKAPSLDGNDSREPLIVEVHSAWRVTAGTGAHPEAVDINREWTITNLPAAISLFSRTVRAMWSSGSSI